MKIPTLDVGQISAPTAVRAPDLRVVQPGGYDALESGINQAGAAIDTNIKAYEKEQDKARASDVADALAQYDQESVNIVHGTGQPGKDGEPDTGFLGLKGKDASENTVPTLEALAMKRKKIRDGLEDPEAQALFEQRSALRETESRKVIASHVAQQTEQAHLDSLQNLQDAAVHAAAMDPDIDLAAQLRMADIAGAARQLGRGKDFEEKVVRDTRQKVTSARLDTLLEAGDVKTAERVFTDNKAALGERYAHYEGAIKLAQQKDGSEALASSLLERSRKSNGFVDETKAIADFAALPPESRTPALKAAFDHGLELAKKQEQGVKADKYNDALAAYLQRMNINDVPAATKMWMIGDGKTPGNDAPSWQRLLAVQHADREYAKGLGPTDAQRWAFAKLDVEMHDNPEKFKQMTPEQFKLDYWSTLAPNDRERAGLAFAGARGQATKAENLSPAESNLLIEAGRKAGLFPQKGQPVGWDGDAADLYNYAKETLEKQKAAQSEPMKPGEMQKWIDRLMIQGKIPNTGILGHFKTGTTRLEAIKNDTGFEPEWSSEEKTKAASALLKKGLQPTDENIDSMLRIINGMQTRPAKAPELPKPPPTDAEVTNEYGLDLSVPAETPPIPDKKDLGLDF